MKELEQKGHNTPVKWINQENNMILTKRKDETSQCLRKKRGKWNGMNGGKQDLEGACLQQRLERSCWKTNNEKNKLDTVLWNTTQNMR